MAVIDMGFHKKTKSFDFVKNILSDTFEMDYFYDDSLEWGAIDTSYINKDYEFHLYLQVLPSFFDLYKIRNKKIIFVPMYDWVVLNPLAWQHYKWFNIKIICFSKKLYSFLKKEWFDCLYVQYFLPPLEYTIDYQLKNIFFWYRWGISFDELKCFLWTQKIDQLTIKNIPDPWCQKLVISDADIKKYNIKFLDTFFDTHKEQYDFLAKHNIFISPRKKEWIGMTFLESMSLGQCVVAYDDGTMNEYLSDWVNWILTRFDKQIDLDHFMDIGLRAKQQYVVDYKAWIENKKTIVPYIDWVYSSVTKIRLSHGFCYMLIAFRRYLLTLKK